MWFYKTLERKGLDDNITKFAGVEYDSTLCQDGYNIAIFNPSLFRGISTEVHKINSLKYETAEL